MKKRIFGIIVTTLLAALLLVSPVWASGANVDVVLSDIVVTGDGETGGTATASGTVTVTATALDTSGSVKSASVEAEAGATVTNPNGAEVDSVADSDSDEETNYPFWWWPAQNADADVTLVLPWAITFSLNSAGEYTITQYGEGIASYLGLLNPITYSNSSTAKYQVAARPVVVLKPEWWPSRRQFAVYADGVHYYNYTDSSTRELPAIDLEGTIQWSGAAYAYHLTIPAGTQVTGCEVLRVKIKDGVPVAVPWSGEIGFSNPIIVE